MFISQDNLDELIKELGISVTEQTSPVELFDAVKKLMVAAINEINQDEIVKSTTDNLGADVKSILASRG